MKTVSVMIVGVGGQGSLLASKLLGRLLVDEGYDVKVSEVHGMSQRGGSVVTYVRFGDKVYSPIITDGEADIIISFEKLEAGRYAKYLKKDGKIVVSLADYLKKYNFPTPDVITVQLGGNDIFAAVDDNRDERIKEILADADRMFST